MQIIKLLSGILLVVATLSARRAMEVTYVTGYFDQESLEKDAAGYPSSESLERFKEFLQL